MKAKNLTPLLFATKVTSRQKRRPEMTAIVRACYVIAPGKPLTLPDGAPGLAQGALTADTYADEDVERAGECLYPGDFADWKPKADVMLRGTCHAPGGEPVTECPVRLSVGRWSKTLRVIGRRNWTSDARDAAMTKPTPFTTMPVDYAHAFGGPGNAANPVGATGRELPSVEHAGRVIEARRDDFGPAGFGPINPAWAPRAGKVGTKYDARWKKTRAPWVAEDFDWTHFNAAPLDQQLDGYLRGDEQVSLQNLHPTAAVLETRLPGIRVRVFVQDLEGRFREVSMNLDTLFVDVDAGKLYLTWRGLDVVKTDDLKDILWALVASERLVDDPLPATHYRDKLQAFAADPLEIKDRVPAEMLGKWEEMSARTAARVEGRPVTHYDAPPPDPLTGSLRKLFDRMPVAPPGAKETEAKVAAAVAQAIAKAPPQANMVDQIAKMALGMEAQLAKPQLAAIPLRPGGPPSAWAAKNLTKMLDEVGEAKKKVAAMPTTSADAKTKVDEAIAALDAQVEDFKQQPLVRAILARPAYQDPGPNKDLHAQDYQGRDLHGVDLRGANLEDANLAGCNLVGANLAGAKLEAAVLAGADLTDADLTGANLTLANLTEVRAARAIFRGTTLTRAFLQKADLRRAVFENAKGEWVFLPDADLEEADARGISLVRSFAKGAKLVRADLSGASLIRCLMLETQAQELKLVGATLTRTSFARSDLTGAALTRAAGERTVWLQAKLHDVDFVHANLPRAQFMEASALRARFRRAILRESRCYRSSFDQSDFTEAQLFGIQFTKCSLRKVRFTKACLYGAKFRQAGGGSCDFSGANLTTALMQDA
jgi:uncharacterized protein YjbI with pentapeptide repeats